MRAKLQAALFLCGVASVAGPAHAALVIAKGQTSNVDCSGGICNATTADAVLNNKDLTNMLAVGDVKVFAEGVATDIIVAAPVIWASSHTLTLGAYGSINVKDTITVQGTSGLTLTANVAQTGGLFRLVGTGKISFWDTTSTLVINNTTYTLFTNLPAIIAAIASNPSGAYALSSDYNAAQDGSYPHSPISAVFNGTLEGLGNAIANLSFSNSNANGEKISLFAQVGSTGQLNDIVLTNVSMQGRAAYLAPLAAINSGTITHSSATSSLAGAGFFADSMAGLVTDNEGTITRSHANGTMDGSATGAGGLVMTNNGTVSLSDASGAVTAVELAGGLVGYSTGTITTSLAQGNVTVSDYTAADAGGLVGDIASGSVVQSFATGEVLASSSGAKKRGAHSPWQRSKKAGNDVGGLAAFSGGLIQDCYATGSVTGIGSSKAKLPAIGGLVGETSSNLNASQIVRTYVLGEVLPNGKKNQGGVIGTDFAPSGSNSLAFWDLDTTGITNPNQGAGNMLNDPGLKGVSDSKFRKTTIKNFDRSVWAEDANINNGYPYLINNPPPQ